MVGFTSNEMVPEIGSDDGDQTLDRSRYWRILWFFGRAIVHVVWWDLLLGRIFRASVRRSRPRRFRLLARRFRHLAVAMGGVLIKLGQFLSARVDVLPPEITDELAGLQDEVPPVPLTEIQAVLAAEIPDFSTHFTDFNPEPLAAASLGQVHRARFRPGEQTEAPDGTAVVLKVQRPGIEAIVRTDLSALNVVARWIMRYGPIRRRADVPALMQEFSATLWEELNYISEADNAERIGRIFARDPGIRIPAVYRRHSTTRVLILEDVWGIKVTDLDGIAAAGIDRRQVAMRLMDAYFRQIFKEGFFHADPHPGNLFVHPVEPPPGQPPTPGRFRLAFVDFGMVGHIEQLTGENLRRMLVAITQRDARALTEAYNDLGFFLPGSDLDRIAEAQAVVLDHIWGRNLLELARPDPREIQELGKEFRDILFEFPFQVPKDFIFLGRAFGMLSGLATLLDPTINPWHLVERYGREIIRDREQREFTLAAVLEWFRPFLLLPGRLERVLAAAEEGRLRVQSVSDRRVLQRLERLERRTSRQNWFLLLAALLLSSTLLYVNDEAMLATIVTAFSSLLLLWLLLNRN